jgi:hypothetical protein
VSSFGERGVGRASSSSWFACIRMEEPDGRCPHSLESVFIQAILVRREMGFRLQAWEGFKRGFAVNLDSECCEVS